MPLYSKLLRPDPALHACLTRDQNSIRRGDTGSHVSRIQTALLILQDLDVSSGELAAQYFGVSTKAAVLEYMRRQGMVNRAWDWRPDTAVGREVIERLDRELCVLETASSAADEAEDFAWTTRKMQGRSA